MPPFVKTARSPSASPTSCVAKTADEHICLATLTRRKNETVTQLLTRFDQAVVLMLTEDIFTDRLTADTDPNVRFNVQGHHQGLYKTQ